MSKFIQGILSDTDTSESEVEEQVEERNFQSYDSDSEEEKRVVRSVKEKKYQEIQNTVVRLKNHRNNNDITHVKDDFEDLIKCYEKWANSMESENLQKFYVRVIADLENQVNKWWENKKDLSKNNSKSLHSLRQRIKKYNKDFESQINDYNANPEIYPTELIEEVKITKVEEKHEYVSDNDAFDDISDEDEELSSSSSEDEAEKERFRNDPAARFLKSYTQSKEKKPKEKPQKKEPREAKKKESIEEEDGWSKVDSHGRIETKLFADDEEINLAKILEKMNNELEGKSSKRDGKKSQFATLQKLYSISVDKKIGLGCQLKLLVTMLSNLLLSKSSGQGSCFSMDNFDKAFDTFSKIVALLRENISELTLKITEGDESEQIETAPFVISGCILSLLEHIETEYEKLLTLHEFSFDKDVEYCDKLKYEEQLILQCSNIRDYITKKGYSQTDICRLNVWLVEHWYYRTDFADYDQLRSLINFIVRNDHTDRLRMRAILQHIYYLALHNRYHQARELFALSNLTVYIEKSDPSTQILYNRVVVQLGVCAFRNNIERDAHQALSELQGSGKVRELLAQAVRTNRSEMTQEEQVRDKSFLLPYHKHINVDLIEGVFLISAMLIEINNCYVQQSDGRRPIMSRNFHHVLKMIERNVIIGPPDNLKEHVIAASKALYTGDWQRACELIFSDKMEKCFWKHFTDYQQLRSALTEKIKVESMKAFLFANLISFDSLSLSWLADVYQLSISVVRMTVNGLILDGKLKALCDDTSSHIIVTQRMSRIQQTGLKLCEKLALLSDLNGKLGEINRSVPDGYMRMSAN